ncbi:alpha/beta hydrolase family protein [Paenibacillus elgii]|uniref:alpha/beta hydrolase family protein n=1 Tax=Paenibacillus elgii TaxID=189691 RepID=UPI0013D7E5DF|nr:acetylhydrolase [Paenibacillus elgii]
MIGDDDFNPRGNAAMRLLEMMNEIVNLGLLGWLIVKTNKQQKALVILAWVSTALSTIQPVVEGFRWQMVPTYLITVFVWLYLLRRSFPAGERKPQTKRARMTLGFLAAIYALIMLLLPMMMPVFTFPKPTGSYAVGTITYDWTDPNRKETYTEASYDRRELMVQVWYPAKENSGGSVAPYLPPGFRSALSREFGLPEFVLSYLDLVKTNSIIQAPLSDAEASYPVVLFSASNGGTRFQNTFQVEGLASRGYIVVGIEHTHHTIATVFSDGHVTGFQRMNLLDFSVMGREVNQVLVKDAQFVLDQVGRLNVNDPSGRFTGKIDMNRIGMMGHSLGGAVTVQMMLHDDRVKAGINMDGTMFGDEIPGSGLNKPFMLMSSASSVAAETEEPNARDLAKYGMTLERFDKITGESLRRKNNALAGGGYLFTLGHTVHYSYSDFYLYSPLVRWMDGTKPRTAHRMINEYTVAFFDRYLKGMPSPLLDSPVNDSKYPELTFVRK